MDDIRRRGGCLIAFGALVGLFGIMGLAVELNEKREPRGFVIAAVFIAIGAAVVWLGRWVRKDGTSLKRIDDLTPADFPEVEPARFEAWKSRYLETAKDVRHAQVRGYWILWPALILELVVRGPIAAVIFILAFIGWLLYMLLYVRRLGDEARRLQHEAGIDAARLQRALTVSPPGSPG